MEIEVQLHLRQGQSDICVIVVLCEQFRSDADSRNVGQQ